MGATRARRTAGGRAAVVRFGWWRRVDEEARTNSRGRYTKGLVLPPASSGRDAASAVAAVAARQCQSVTGRPCCDDGTPAERAVRRTTVATTRARRGRHVVASHRTPDGVHRLLRAVPGGRSVRIFGHRGAGRSGPGQGAQGSPTRFSRRAHVCRR